MNRSRILIVLTPGFPENENDSTCLPAQQLFIKKFTEQYPAVSTVVLSFHYPYTTRPYHWNGVLVIPFNGRNKRKGDKLLLWRKAWRSMRALAKQESIWGILSFWCTECALLGHYFSRRYKFRHYCWILGQDAKADNRFVKYIRPAPSELIALSPFLADTFEKNHGIRPAYMIPNAVDGYQKVIPASKRNIDILAAGSLIPLKRYDLLITIVSSLTKKFPDLKVVLIGAGPMAPTLENMIKEKKLHHQIEMKGELPHHQVLKLMRHARIFVHPSLYEGFSTVCLEALQAGAHVVSFTDPLQQQVEQWHVAAGETEMEHIIVALLGDPSLEHKSIVPFTMEESAKAIGRLFDSPLNRNS